MAQPGLFEHHARHPRRCGDRGCLRQGPPQLRRTKGARGHDEECHHEGNGTLRRPGGDSRFHSARVRSDGQIRRVGHPDPRVLLRRLLHRADGPGHGRRGTLRADDGPCDELHQYPRSRDPDGPRTQQRRTVARCEGSLDQRVGAGLRPRPGDLFPEHHPLRPARRAGPGQLHGRQQGAGGVSGLFLRQRFLLCGRRVFHAFALPLQLHRQGVENAADHPPAARLQLHERLLGPARKRRLRADVLVVCDGGDGFLPRLPGNSGLSDRQPRRGPSGTFARQRKDVHPHSREQ